MNRARVQPAVLQDFLFGCAFWVASADAEICPKEFEWMVEQFGEKKAAGFLAEYLPLDDEAFFARLGTLQEQVDTAQAAQAFPQLRKWLLELALVDGIFSFHERRTVKDLLRRLGIPTAALKVRGKARKPLRRERPAAGPEDWREAILSRRYAPPLQLALLLSIGLAFAGWLVGYLCDILPGRPIPALNEFLGVFFGTALRLAGLLTLTRHDLSPGTQAAPDCSHMLAIFATAYIVAILLPTHWLLSPAILLGLLLLCPALHTRMRTAALSE